ncbi:hypothetical protein [Streptomyces sp. ML-6]|uniref:hypothetical protein n=1 Tax=Streptomyces sp. ML-6 TaxID=2982693 RepID=UPI0024C0092B|nr:hypothetical protein [Streptomyces sp. ML-6]MDK0518258.1 hypothetical protein [Streptomyces sp. ML-6]
MSARRASRVGSPLSPDADIGTDVILLIGLEVGVDHTLFHGALLLVAFAMTVYAFCSVALGLIGVALNLLFAAAADGSTGPPAVAGRTGHTGRTGAPGDGRLVVQAVGGPGSLWKSQEVIVLGVSRSQA